MGINLINMQRVFFSKVHRLEILIQYAQKYSVQKQYNIDVLSVS